MSTGSGAASRSVAAAPPPGRVGARRGVTEIILGTVVGQGVLVATAPVLSRLYSPADFALLQVFTGVVSIGAVLASMRLELAIPLARDRRETRAVLRVGLVSLVVIAVVLGLLGFVTSDLWARGATLRGLRDLWWLVPFTVAALALFQLVSAVLVRAERYRDLAGRNAVQGIGTAAAQLAFGLAGVRPLGLLLGMGLGRLTSLVSVVGRAALFGRRADLTGRAGARHRRRDAVGARPVPPLPPRHHLVGAAQQRRAVGARVRVPGDLRRDAGRLARVHDAADDPAGHGHRAVRRAGLHRPRRGGAARGVR